MSRRPRLPEPVELLDQELGETFEGPSHDDWRAQTGCDGRRAVQLLDEEDEK